MALWDNDRLERFKGGFPPPLSRGQAPVCPPILTDRLAGAHCLPRSPDQGDLARATSSSLLEA